MPRDTSVCIFFKPPIAGAVKTRLIPQVGSNGAAALAKAFFRDTWDAVASLEWAIPILASAGLLNPDLLPGPKPITWLQGKGDLGARLERILGKALEITPLAIVVGTDSPGMPTRLFHQAHDALQEADAILGPCDDGGFYLLGLRRYIPGVLTDISWSEATTFEQTWQRLIDAGLNPKRLEPWYDVDRPEDLDRLQGDIAAQAIAAPHTASVLASLPSPGRDNPLPSTDAETSNARYEGTQVE